VEEQADRQVVKQTGEQVEEQAGGRKCAACGMSFTSQKLLQKHVKCVHGDTTDHSCVQCGLVFTEHVKLARHARVCGVPGLRNTQLDECALCEKRFSRPGNLRRHLIAAHKVLLRGSGPSFLQRVRARRAKRAATALACNICLQPFPANPRLYPAPRPINLCLGLCLGPRCAC
jgi:uncharacterized C2H2 Zn-finger protein